MAIKRIQPKWLADMIHVVFDPLGPSIGNNVPIGQYGFFKTSDKEQSRAYGSYRDLSKIEPITRFTFLKQKSGLHKNEFFEYDMFYKVWGSKYLDNGIFASKKYDGRDFSLQKKGDKVAIISEDQHRDRSKEFPNIVKELKSIDDDFILHAEAVCYDCKNKRVNSALLKESSCEEISREDTSYLTVGKISPEQESGVVFHIHDAVYMNKDIHDLSYKDRIDLVVKRLSGEHKFISIIKTSPQIKTPSELETWTDRLRKMKGSEGVLYRTADATYPIKKSGINRSSLLAKIENLKSVNVMVWNRIPKKSATGELNQYMYDCLYKVPCDTKEVNDVIKHKGSCYAPIEGGRYVTG